LAIGANHVQSGPLADVAAAAMKVLATAVTQLAGIRAGKLG
jgi:hypothetical protein